MAEAKKEPATQQTPKGLEIPVPKRSTVMDALTKAAQPLKRKKP